LRAERPKSFCTNCFCEKPTTPNGSRRRRARCPRTTVGRSTCRCP
jgi:hypothetical protein